MRTRTESNSGSTLFGQLNVEGALTDAMIDIGLSVFLISDLFVNSNPFLSCSVMFVETYVVEGFGCSNVNVMKPVLATSWINSMFCLGIHFLENHFIVVGVGNHRLMYYPPNSLHVEILLGKCNYYWLIL